METSWEHEFYKDCLLYFTLYLFYISRRSKKVQVLSSCYSILDRSSVLLTPLTVNTTLNINHHQRNYIKTFIPKRKWFGCKHKNKNTDKVINCSFSPFLIFASHFILYLIPFVKAMRMVETTQFHNPVILQVFQFSAVCANTAHHAVQPVLPPP